MLRILACSMAVWLLTGCGTLLPQGVWVAPPVADDARLRAELPKTQPAETLPDYRIGVSDELDIKFADLPELDERVRVRPDGNISLAFVGTLRAEGMTPAALEGEVRRRFRQLAAAEKGEKEYIIRPNDVLEVKFTYRAELGEKQRVRPDGRLMLPLVGSVVAEGKTPEQLAQELRGLYAKHLRIPDLVVIVLEASLPRYRVGGREVRLGFDRADPVVIVRSFTMPQVFVGGEVVRPGVLAHRRNLTLLQAVIEAGGHKPTGELRSVLVLRRTDAAQPLVIRRDISADLEQNQTNDIFLEPYDMIVVPKTAVATLAENLEQYVFNILPFVKNSAFSFIYQVNRTETKVVP